MWHNNTPHYKKRKFSKKGACPTSLSERCSSRRFSLSLSSRGYLNDGKEATGHFMLRRSSFCRQLAWLRDCAPKIRVDLSSWNLMAFFCFVVLFGSRFPLCGIFASQGFLFFREAVRIKNPWLAKMLCGGCSVVLSGRHDVCCFWSYVVLFWFFSLGSAV